MSTTNSLKSSPMIAVSVPNGTLKTVSSNNTAVFKPTTEKKFTVKSQSVSLESIKARSKKGVMVDKSFQNPAEMNSEVKIKGSVDKYGLTTSAVDEAIKLFEEVSRDWG